ncbi:MAG: hypothetical protein B7733_24750 [Myxococcales bacterium FL481]|nr:MAG: hypothetical protein B7733_24750 [Myxococcales bacterium FL481]
MRTPNFIKTAGLLAVTVVTLGVAAPAIAGGQRGHHRQGPNTEQRIEHMTNTLGLSAEQAQQLRDRFAQIRTTRDAIRSDDSLSKDEKRAKHRELKAASRDAVAAVLTPEQKATMRAIRAEKRRERAANRMQKLTILLELTPAQVASIEHIQADAASERKQIIAEAGGDRTAVKPALKAHHKQTRADIRSVLSEEQAAKLDALEPARRQGKKGKRRNRGKHGERGGE